MSRLFNAITGLRNTRLVVRVSRLDIRRNNAVVSDGLKYIASRLPAVRVFQENKQT